MYSILCVKCTVYVKCTVRVKCTMYCVLSAQCLLSALCVQCTVLSVQCTMYCVLSVQCVLRNSVCAVCADQRGPGWGGELPVPDRPLQYPSDLHHQEV